MTITNSGMTLYADHDTQETWSGTDDLDTYNTSVQGTNSESWLVSKNSTETGTLTKSATMTGAKYFTVWMKSDLTNYYTSIKKIIRSSTNNEESFTTADTTNRDVTGEFHPSILQFGQGTTTGTLDLTSVTEFECELNNSTSGNIRSVTNNWIDTMHYGAGRTISGTTASDELFNESHTADTTTNDEYDGCSELFKSGIVYYTDLTITTTTGNSYGETVSFGYQRNTDNIYTITLTGTANFKGTTLIGQGGSVVGWNSTGATSFSWNGGGITNGNTVKFKSGESISNIVLTACKEADSNGATLSGVTIADTTESTTGSLIVNSLAEAASMTGMKFSGYSTNSRYAVYVDASVTSFTMSNWDFDVSTSFALYWAGTSGTLTVNATNGTNISLSGCTANTGGTIVVSNPKYKIFTGLPTNTEVRVRQGSETLAHNQNVTSGSYTFNYSPSGDAPAVAQFTLPGYIIESINILLDSTDQTLPVTVKNDPSYL